MAKPHCLLLGCGDVGTRVGLELAASGWQISALRRSPDQLPREFRRLEGDYTRSGGLSSLADEAPDFIVFTPLPTSRDIAGYERGYWHSLSVLAQTAVMRCCQRLFFVSSTRVYGDADGGWVDEQSPIDTSDPRSAAIIEGENAARALGACTVIRPSGLYGSPPGRLLQQVAQGAVSNNTTQFSNRIHREDLAGVLSSLLRQSAANQELPETLIASDDAPCSAAEIQGWLADQLGVKNPTLSTPTAPRKNRRCSNRRLHETGYRLRYPSYREGYRELIDSYREQRAQ
ncbi:ActC family protein [Luminiphilus syltensis NOR5-1B]|uniref:ActC family protein n=1 Tax=Luminiphilus syltensis NOR5-1B TaxID=565045 RepID=B8KUA8_9GAMM|nr:NAD-dependent epimerase/dehydratase family protein [Luminiphilus syltensis]EED36156.1 ActC family protein [Luminiphilus syltensis NOR5-1B]